MSRVTEIMNAGRVLSHGKITDLSVPFSLPGKVSFSIFLAAKSVTSNQVITLSCKLYKDKASSECPFNINTWTEPAVILIDPNPDILNDFDIYWGAGQEIDK